MHISELLDAIITRKRCQFLRDALVMAECIISTIQITIALLLRTISWNQAVAILRVLTLEIM